MTTIDTVPQCSRCGYPLAAESVACGQCFAPVEATPPAADGAQPAVGATGVVEGGDAVSELHERIAIEKELKEWREIYAALTARTILSIIRLDQAEKLAPLVKQQIDELEEQP